MYFLNETKNGIMLFEGKWPQEYVSDVSTTPQSQLFDGT
jgi:hypothetical protein